MATVRTLLALSALALAGCYDQGDGVEPPLTRIYFPTGLVMSPGGTRLYVVNSDFDLQYNSGSVQALDLERVRQVAPRYCLTDADCAAGSERCDTTATDDNRGFPSHWCVATDGPHAGKPCGPFGEKSDAQELLYPGRCNYVSPTKPQDGLSPLVVGRVGIGAFATDVIYRKRPNGPGGRLFIPVRGDATLHYIDVIDDTETPTVPFELECGQAGNGDDCDDAHRRGDDPDEENTRGLRLLSEPFGIDATADGEAIVLTHQTEGAASLFVNDADSWGDGEVSFGVGPKLQFAVSGMPSRPIGVAAVPVPALAREQDLGYLPGFLVTFRDAPQVNLLRYYADAQGDPQRPFIQVAGSVGISANSLGFDSRGIAIDASERQACEAKAPADPGAARTNWLADCAATPLRVYIANRSPTTLLVGQTRANQSATFSDDLPQITDSIPMPFGASRVIVGHVIDKLGQLATRVFLVCFDSRRIGVYDPVGRKVEKWIETGRGPHSLVVDTATTSAESHAFAYVAHFTDSYVGVIDLDQRHPTYGQIVATIGKPTPPRASK